jgi:hypothetical protein
MRQSEAWTVLFQQFNEACMVGNDLDRPRLDPGEYAFVELPELEAHGAR